MPALLTRTSTAPKLVVGAVDERLELVPVADVAGAAEDAPPGGGGDLARAVASQASCLRLAITTSAPSAAKASAIARPRPRLPPVTSATRPVRSNSACGGVSIARFYCPRSTAVATRLPAAPMHLASARPTAAGMPFCDRVASRSSAAAPSGGAARLGRRQAARRMADRPGQLLPHAPPVRPAVRRWPRRADRLASWRSRRPRRSTPVSSACAASRASWSSPRRSCCSERASASPSTARAWLSSAASPRRCRSPITASTACCSTRPSTTWPNPS